VLGPVRALKSGDYLLADAELGSKFDKAKELARKNHWWNRIQKNAQVAPQRTEIVRRFVKRRLYFEALPYLRLNR
jgi:hypothetical protein